MTKIRLIWTLSSTITINIMIHVYNCINIKIIGLLSIKVFDDSLARADWGWQHSIGLEQLVDIMITNLR